MAGVAVERAERPGAGRAQECLGKCPWVKIGRRPRPFGQPARHRAGQLAGDLSRHSGSPKSFTDPPPNPSSATIFLTFATIAPVRRGTLEPGAGRVFARLIHARRPPMPTIALVDDDRNILTSVSIALESEGYRIMTYTDGASALDGFRTSPPDLAILDIKMPRMDGMETLRRLRQKSDLPVIFLTSKDEEIDELFGLKMGADDFIRKPFSQRLLVERVKAVLRRSAPK